MFTGIVETTGRVVRIQPGASATEFHVNAGRLARALRRGGSVAVNGACLTVVGKRGAVVRFDVLNETLRVTNFGDLQPGGLVNLERPLRANARLDGHFVLGHVDGTGVVRRWEKAGTDYVLEVTAPAEVMRYVLYKGSIAVDGISLTVADCGEDWFRVWIIPHTYRITNLRGRRVGDRVNLEADILGKYVEKLLAQRAVNR
ncbi:MAG: riboflavin synthase [Verrucomicrobiae bacterium]|nr:riboflavin synthase [Verrucomicrobiae bacterium]